MKNSLLIDVGVLAVLIVIGAGGYWLSPLLLPKADVVANPDPGCDLHRQACGATLPAGGKIQIAITPQPIPMMQPLTIEVRLAGLETQRVAVDLAGVGMSMGYNRPELTLAAPGRFVGNTSLPVCITGSMTWQATILLETARQRISIPFRFTSLPH